MRTKGTVKQLAARRHRGLALLRRGKGPTSVARLLGVTRRVVQVWQAEAKRGKRKRTTRPPGRPCRLSVAQWKGLEKHLRRGAPAHDYEADYWTLGRIVHLIETLFGVRYLPSGVWRLLRRQRWSCQKPQRRAAQRDDAAIAHWRRYHWPQIKKVASTRREPCFRGRKWLQPGIAAQAHLGAARANAGRPHKFATSRASQRDWRIGHFAWWTQNQTLHSDLSLQSDGQRSDRLSPASASHTAWPHRPRVGSCAHSPAPGRSGFSRSTSTPACLLLSHLCAGTQPGGVRLDASQRVPGEPHTPSDQRSVDPAPTGPGTHASFAFATLGVCPCF